MTYNYSFQPNGKWFVFIEETGETLAKDLAQQAALEKIMALRYKHG